MFQESQMAKASTSTRIEPIRREKFGTVTFVQMLVRYGREGAGKKVPTSNRNGGACLNAFRRLARGKVKYYFLCNKR
jgi:hypothetical protein